MRHVQVLSLAALACAHPDGTGAAGPRTTSDPTEPGTTSIVGTHDGPRTFLTYLRDGHPTLFVVEEGIELTLAETTQSAGRVDLGPRTLTATWCTTDTVWYHRDGATHALDSVGPYDCDDPVLDPDEDGIVWVQQLADGWEIRHRALDGTPRPGHGWKLPDVPWKPRTLPDDPSALYAIHTIDDHGPPVRFDLEATTTETLHPQEVHVFWDLPSHGVGAAAAGLALLGGELRDGWGILFESPVESCLDTATPEPLCFFTWVYPSVDPDGRRVAVIGRGTPGLNDDRDGDVFVYHLDSGILERLTDDDTPQLQTAWSVDGRTVFTVVPEGLQAIPVDDPSAAELVLSHPIAGDLSARWRAD